MSRYSTVLFDLDHTLLDSDESERAAFHATLTEAGAPSPQDHKDSYDQINRSLWDRVEAGDVSPDFVKLERFVQLAALLGLDADPRVMATTFATGLGDFGELYAGALPVLEALQGSYRMALITNGLSGVQRRRVERLHLGAYFEAIVISAEIGHAKPSHEIFDVTFESLDWPEKSEVVIVGDSLTSDIAGGIGYGIDTVWLNHHNAEPVPGITHEISRIADVVKHLT